MEKNLISAVVLSVLFLMGWYYFFVPRAVPPPAKSVQSKQGSVQSELSDKNSTIEKAGVSSKQSAKDTGGVSDALSSFRKQTKNLTSVEIEKSIDTPLARIVLTSRGAGVKHWWLKEAGNEASTKQHSNGSVKRSSPQSEAERGVSFSQHWPDLVNYSDSDGKAREISIEELPFSTFPELNFEEVKDTTPGEIESIWRAQLPSGLELEKRYVWGNGDQAGSKNSYFARLVLSFTNPTNQTIELKNFSIGWGGGLGTVDSEKKENTGVNRVLAYPSPTKEIMTFKTGEYPAGYAWMGIDNRYYLAAMIPQLGQFGFINTIKSKTNPSEAKLATKSLEIAPKSSKTFELKLYAGPKGYTQLKKWGLGLEHAVDFGYFGFLGKWALKALYWLHQLTGNYGWAIIILTCLLQIIMLPLSLKSYQSMAGMKKIQPKIQELQKRYKDDPKRLNQEMLNLYKEGKTNPFGGCIPMILQIPVFWAFFTMLRNSYELHGTPWMWWIKDLSQRDPYYILPIVMGAGMFLQQKISGTAGGDPTQAKMMTFMPIIFTFMFLNFPSGLVLYWLTNSILSMVTQYLCTKKYGAQPSPSPQLATNRLKQ